MEDDNAAEFVWLPRKNLAFEWRPLKNFRRQHIFNEIHKPDCIQLAMVFLRDRYDEHFWSSKVDDAISSCINKSTDLIWVKSSLI